MVRHREMSRRSLVTDLAFRVVGDLQSGRQGTKRERSSSEKDCLIFIFWIQTRCDAWAV